MPNISEAARPTAAVAKPYTRAPRFFCLAPLNSCFSYPRSACSLDPVSPCSATGVMLQSEAKNILSCIQHPWARRAHKTYSHSLPSSLPSPLPSLLALPSLQPFASLSLPPYICSRRYMPPGNLPSSPPPANNQEGLPLPSPRPSRSRTSCVPSDQIGDNSWLQEIILLISEGQRPSSLPQWGNETIAS